MEDDVAVAESAAEAVKGLGLRKYLWLYFFVVPLAAATASSVAVGIAALQGLADHPAAFNLYALVVMAAFKLIAVLGAGYSLALLLALLTSATRLLSQTVNTRPEKLLPKAGDLIQADLTAKNLSKFFSSIAMQRSMLGLSVAYAVLAVTGGFLAFVLPDVQQIYLTLETIASPAAIAADSASP